MSVVSVQMEPKKNFRGHRSLYIYKVQLLAAGRWHNSVAHSILEALFMHRNVPVTTESSRISFSSHFCSRRSLLLSWIAAVRSICLEALNSVDIVSVRVSISASKWSKNGKHHCSQQCADTFEPHHDALTSDLKGYHHIRYSRHIFVICSNINFKKNINLLCCILGVHEHLKISNIEFDSHCLLIQIFLG